MSTRQFGERVQRREDPRLLTGNGRPRREALMQRYGAAMVAAPDPHARTAFSPPVHESVHP